jgi:hypothetical protein
MQQRARRTRRLLHVESRSDADVSERRASRTVEIIGGTPTAQHRRLPAFLRPTMGALCRRRQSAPLVSVDWRLGRWGVRGQTQLKETDGTSGERPVERSRRDFLRSAGLGGALLAFPSLFAACSADATAPAVLAPNQADDSHGSDPHAHGAVVLNFGTDVGVLNYAYALEQLEAAFYTTVLHHPYQGITSREMTLLRDVRDHEVVHRDFLRAALGDQRIRDLTPNLAPINFLSRDEVLNTARTFEDLGVAAYNGAAKYLESDVYLTIAGKIVSVEARHASAIRDLLQPKTGYFAPKAFDDALAPATVLAAASAFIVDKITVVNA